MLANYHAYLLLPNDRACLVRHMALADQAHEILTFRMTASSAVHA